jgi:hypothetical protein
MIRLPRTLWSDVELLLGKPHIYGWTDMYEFFFGAVRMFIDGHLHSDLFDPEEAKRVTARLAFTRQVVQEASDARERREVEAAFQEHARELHKMVEFGERAGLLKRLRYLGQVRQRATDAGVQRWVDALYFSEPRVAEAVGYLMECNLREEGTPAYDRAQAKYVEDWSTFLENNSGHLTTT